MSRAGANALVVYQENKPYVRRALGAGQIEYLALTEWSFQDRFFAFLLATGFLPFAQMSFPTPRVKEEIPVWFLTACALVMKLHAEWAYSSLGYLLKSGAVLARVGFNVGEHPGGGFNSKNKKPRETAVDPDAVRKFYKDTPAVYLFRWFNMDVARWLDQQEAFDPEGRFIIDLTLLPVPRNPNYKHVAWLPLDAEGHYVDTSQLTPSERKKFRPTPCYALVSLLHVQPWAGGYIYAGAYLLSGKCNPVYTAERLLRRFIEAVGPGVVKQLILDRGFIDGKFVTGLKRHHGIDVLIPLRCNMNALKEAQDLIRYDKLPWSDYSVKEDSEGKTTREEVAGVQAIREWEVCEEPLYVGVMRTTKSDGQVECWGLASTRAYKNPADAFRDYEKRTEIEERHRQLKLCWNLLRFPSTDFNAIAAHVYSILLTYTLVELYLKKENLSDLTPATIRTLQHEERLGKDAVIVYVGRYFATFDLDEYTDIILHLRPEPLQRMRNWIRVFRQTKMRSP